MSIAYIITMILLLAASWFLIKAKKIRSFCLTTLFIACLMELLFNFNSFYLLFGNYKQTLLNSSGAEVTGFIRNTDGTLTAPENCTATIAFKDVSMPVGTIRLDADLPESMPQCSVSIDASDETSSDYRIRTAKGQFIRNNSRSDTIVCQFSGDVKNLRLNFSVPQGGTFTLRSVMINVPVEFHFSVLRLLLICFLAFSVYALIYFPSLKKSFEENRKVCRRISAAMTVVLIGAAVCITLCYSQGRTQGILNDFKSTSGNQITQELVDAFENHQVFLLAKPSAQLLALDNPYDWSARSSQNISYLWDHCLYNGNYYSYYGIAPVLLLFLPYHLLTGFYFPTPEAVLLFGSIGIVFLTLLYLEFIRKLFPSLPLKIVLPGLAILQFASGIWLCFCSPLFYEIASSSGFACMTSGFYFLLRSNVIGDGKIVRYKLVIAAVLLSLSVLCRPTLAVYCAAALVCIWFGFAKLRRETAIPGKGLQKRYLSYFAASLLPFILIGGIQMGYNYVRFGSPFDFGIRYSLTINDFIHSQFHARFAMIGFYNYLFAFPQVTTKFPFIQSSFQDLNVNGYYFVANTVAVGLLFRALPMFSYAYAGRALRRLDRPNRRMALSLTGIICVAAPLIIIFSIWQSGYGARYCIDFSWQMIIGAFAIAYFLYTKSANASMKRAAEKLFLACAVLALFVNFALIYSYLLGQLQSNSLKAAFYGLERLFEIW